MTAAIYGTDGILNRFLRIWFAALFLFSSAIAFVDDFKTPVQPIDFGAQGIGKGAWWFVPGLLADQFGAQDAVFYEFGLPTAPRMEQHMFASLRSELLWAQFGREWAAKGTPKGFSAVLALGMADPIFRLALPLAEQSRLAAEDRAANLLRFKAIRSARGIASAALFLATTDLAQAWTHGVAGGGGGGTCPMGVNADAFGTSDGCPAAPTGTVNNITLIQKSTFFTGYAQQSGQASPYAGRPTFNVPGVDYPVGLPSSVTIKDPSAGGLPTNCTYNPTGSGNSGPIITGCNTASPTFNSFDFSGTLIGSHGCVLMNFSSGANGTITFKNSYFGVSSLCRGGSYNSGLNIGMFQVNPGAASWDFENNVWDWSPVVTASSILPTSLSAGDWTILYNACLNISAAGCWPGTSPTGNLTVRWDYVENYDFNVVTQGHGEIIAQHGVGIHPTTFYEFVTILEGSVVGGGALTSNIYVANGNGTAEYTQVIIEGDVTVENNSAGGGNPSSDSAFGFLEGTHDGTVINGNWWDNTSSNRIIRSNAVCNAPVTYANNSSLLTGANVAKATAINVTGGSGC